MKILLVGEYSRLHNSLKEGLLALGHEVVLAGNTDGFKNYDVDIKFGAKLFNKSFWFKVSKIFDKVFGINLVSLENRYRFHKVLPNLKDFDIVQLYNESIIKVSPKTEIYFIKKIIESNKNTFLLSCGIDYTSIKYANDKKFKYSILTPLHQNSTHKKHYEFILKKISPSNKMLHEFLFKNVNGVIASDLDYHLPLQDYDAYLGMTPNPINVDRISYQKPIIANKIIIFHGVNTNSYIRKGNVFFDEAIKILKSTYGEKIEVVRTEDIPYNDYIKTYDSCHILLDQVYAYDQGYNALEAMAKGKVVFTGAEHEWLEHYQINEDTVAINALPDADYLVKKLSWLIENPDKIIEISKNARAFIEREHHYVKIAKQYITIWGNNSKL